MGLLQAKKLLQGKGDTQESEETTQQMKENICKIIQLRNGEGT